MPYNILKAFPFKGAVKGSNITYVDRNPRLQIQDLEDRRRRRCWRVAVAIHGALTSPERGELFYFAVAATLLFFSDMVAVHNHRKKSDRCKKTNRVGLIDAASTAAVDAFRRLESAHKKLVISHNAPPTTQKIAVKVAQFEANELDLPLWGFFLSPTPVKQIMNMAGLGDALSTADLHIIVHRLS